MNLKDAVVVVTGGSSGLGLGVAKRVHAAGAQVVIVARDPERLEAARREIGDRTRTFSVDVADEDAVADMFQQLERVDHLVAMAGAPLAAFLANTETAVLRRTMDVVFWGSLYACRYAAPLMSPSGSITLCSGVATRRPPPGRSVGVAARCAVEGFGRALAVELGPIRVNTVCPGLIHTAMFDDFLGERREGWVEENVARLPVRRLGQTEDVASAVLFLMCNPHVTGITLRVDGGYPLS